MAQSYTAEEPTRIEECNQPEGRHCRGKSVTRQYRIL